MTSENYPPQSNSQNAQPGNGAGQPSDGGQAPGGQPYPQATVNTGEYRRVIQPSAGSPGPDHDDQAGNVRPASGHVADTGPVHQAPTTEAAGSAPVWQSRPSGALAAEAWSSPSASAYPAAGSSYSPGDQGTGQYGTGQSGTGQSGTGQSSTGQHNSGQSGTSQYGSAGAAGQYGTSQYPAGGYGAYRADQRSDAYPGAYYGAPGQPAGYGDYRPSQGAAIAANGTGTKSRSRSRGLVAAVTVLVLAAGFGAGLAGAALETHNNPVATSSLSQPSTAPVVADAQPIAAGSVESVAAKLLPSVVSILSISSTQEAEGSGVILTSDGNILTNNHVIAGATELTVKFNDGTTAAAKVVGADATDDLAVVKVSGVSNLTVATLGVSADVKVGQQVVGGRFAARPVGNRHLGHRVRAQPAGPHGRRGQHPGSDPGPQPGLAHDDHPGHRAERNPDRCRHQPR